MEGFKAEVQCYSERLIQLAAINPSLIEHIQPALAKPVADLEWTAANHSRSWASLGKCRQELLVVIGSLYNSLKRCISCGT